MPETKNGENSPKFGAIENKVEQNSGVVGEARPITLEEHLAQTQMENETITFPVVEVAPTTIAKADDVANLELTKEGVMEEEKMRTEVNEEEGATNSFTKASEVLNSMPQPVVVSTTKLESTLSLVVYKIKELVMKIVEEGSNRAVRAFAVGILIGAVLTFLLF